jgi:hypothetical protein
MVTEGVARKNVSASKGRGGGPVKDLARPWRENQPSFFCDAEQKMRRCSGKSGVKPDLRVGVEVLL